MWDIPSFHDGRLQGLFVDEKMARLLLRRTDGGASELILHGVETLQADNFRQGNIIGDLQIVSGCDPADPRLAPALAKLYPAPHPAADSKFHRRHEAYVAQKMNSICAAEKTLVLIDSSYGCELSALCESMELLTNP